MKAAFVNKLREVFVREYSIAPQDVGSAASNISVRRLDGGGVHGGCVAVFDEIYGSLRLTERLYTDFQHVLDRFLAAVKADSTETRDSDLDLERIVTQIKDEASVFTGDSIPEGIADAPKGYELVFRPESRVCFRQVGALAIDVEIIQPTMMDGRLMYQIKVPSSTGKRWVDAAAVEPSADADAWECAWWNRETEAYEDPPEGGGI